MGASTSAQLVGKHLACHAVEPREYVVVIGNLSRAAPGNLEHFRCGIFGVGAGETANTVGKDAEVVTSV
jgi:hypothetical protein